MKGSKAICARCSTLIIKGGFDPDICRWCELEVDFSGNQPFNNL